MSNGCPVDVHWTGGLGTSLVSEDGMSNGRPMGRPLDRWTGRDSGTSLVSEGGMSNGYPMDIHWTGGTIPSGQRTLMANLDMSGLSSGHAAERGQINIGRGAGWEQCCVYTAHVV